MLVHKSYSAVIFDLDGTLLDSLWVWEKVDEDFFREKGVPMPPDFFDTTARMTFMEVAEYTKALLGLQERPESLVATWNRMALDEYGHNVRLKPGAGDYVKRLFLEGVKLGIVTTLSKTLADAALKNNAVSQYFSAFFSTADTGYNKNGGEIYLKAAEALETPPERCLVYDDLLSGVTGAKKAGMDAIGVYDPYSAGEKAGILAAGSSYIRDFSQGWLPEEDN